MDSGRSCSVLFSWPMTGASDKACRGGTMFQTSSAQVMGVKGVHVKCDL